MPGGAEYSIAAIADILLSVLASWKMNILKEAAGEYTCDVFASVLEDDLVVLAVFLLDIAVIGKDCLKVFWLWETGRRS